jgi:hypothetical protein
VHAEHALRRRRRTSAFGKSTRLRETKNLASADHSDRWISQG